MNPGDTPDFDDTADAEYVYAIGVENEFGNLFDDTRNIRKIGRSTDPRARLYSLQGGNPKKLHLVAMKETNHASELEAFLQREFSDFQVRREWFALPHDQHDRLTNYLDAPESKVKEFILSPEERRELVLKEVALR